MSDPKFDTVQDLINFLSQYPPDSQVFIYDAEYSDEIPLDCAEYVGEKRIVLY